MEVYVTNTIYSLYSTVVFRDDLLFDGLWRLRVPPKLSERLLVTSGQTFYVKPSKCPTEFQNSMTTPKEFTQQRYLTLPLTVSRRAQGVPLTSSNLFRFDSLPDVLESVGKFTQFQCFFLLSDSLTVSNLRFLFTVNLRFTPLTQSFSQDLVFFL